MASLRDIKIRIKSVQSTKKITKAMEMIEASKMRRAQLAAIKGRPYLRKLEEVIGNLVNYSDPVLSHPFLKKRDKVKNVGYIFMTSNRGFCGGFNSNIIRKMVEILREEKDKKELILTVGKKGRQAMERIGKGVLADFEKVPERATFLDTVGISRVIADDFLSGKLDEVYIVYNHFYSSLSQKPVVKKLLPIEPGSTDGLGMIGAKAMKHDYIFEQDREKLLNELMHRYIETIVFQTVLESFASEHSARMMAMRQASDNASDIITNLTLHYNKARQAKITKEILEIVSGSSA